MTKRIILKTAEFITIAFLTATIAYGGEWVALYLGCKHRND